MPESDRDGSRTAKVAPGGLSRRRKQGRVWLRGIAKLLLYAAFSTYVTVRMSGWWSDYRGCPRFG
jgi:hypothetical protein